ncbi:MAG: hypothetical protein ACXVFH_17580 [Solirubrobacteraceae bacterium]
MSQWYIALLGRQFPGSWLPFGEAQVVECAERHFRLVSSISGRLDYIETINRWNARLGAPSFTKTLLKLRLVGRRPSEWVSRPIRGASSETKKPRD